MEGGWKKRVRQKYLPWLIIQILLDDFAVTDFKPVGDAIRDFKI